MLHWHKFYINYLRPGAQVGYRLSCSIMSVTMIADIISPVHVPQAAALNISNIDSKNIFGNFI